MTYGRLSLSLVLILLIPITTTAATDPVAAARAHLDANRARYNLTATDLEGMTLSDNYSSRHNGVSHVYWLQRHAGISVFNGIANVNVARDGRLVHMGSRFAPNVAGTVNATAPLVSASDAVRRAADHLGLIATDLTVARTIGGAEQAIVFTGAGFSRREVPAKLTYYRVNNNSVRLAWDIAIEPDSLHYWEVLVDAVTGAILFKYNHVQNDSYKVFAWPAESPNHVAAPLPKQPADGREVVTDRAANPVASPHGWHDVNGVAGADTIDTSGNNVNAQTDLDNNDQYVPTQDVRPNSLTRDFQPVLDLTKWADQYREAAVVNLFYWNNVNHDLHYLYGFDEAAGNFQLNNYTLAGRNADPVKAEAQDGSGTNNANMLTPADGESPRMQMYVWTPRISNQVAVNSPAGLGPYAASAAQYGPPLTETGITGDVIHANDGIGTTADACEALPSSVAGKIVLAERGTCNFIIKTQNAQAAGAKGVIIYNNQPGDPITMSGTADPNNPITIPTVMILQTAGIELRDSGPANVSLRNVAAAIPTRDSDLDNGVIIHEYGHGVSNRLTGGPARITCLTNAQQGGEGWSDFWAMAFTQRAGSNGSELRGMGAYLYYQDDPATGRGIRPYPYSTDKRINPMTYGDLGKGTLAVPHGTGSVWATTLWEMYWALVNGVPSLGLPGYGFREDIYDMTAPLAGNQIALQLVMDGLKLQPCNPSFVDARDAILAADEVNYGGRHKWHIWWAFAKRGLGAGAGDNDGGLLVAESFAMPVGAPGACTQAPAFKGLERIVPATDGTCAISLYWSSTDSDPCSTGSVTYSIYRGTTSTFATNASTRIASGLTTTSYVDEAVVGGTRYFYIVRAVDGFGNEDPNRNIQSEVPAGTLTPGGSFSDNGGDTGPTRFTSTDGWVIRPTNGVGHTATTPSKQYATSAAGNYPNMACMNLTSETIYLGTNSTLSFATIWAMEPTWDAGILEITTADSGFTQWEKIDMTYPGIVLGADGAEIACANPGLRKNEPAFTATSGVLWVTFNVPLTAYANKPVRIRFVFGSDAGTGDAGWRLDNISVSNVMQTGACNTRPDAVNDTASVAEDRSVAVSVLANDSDLNGDPLTVTRAGGASHGTTRVNANNTVTYTPAANFHGSDSFTYTVSDGKGGTDTATVSVTVDSVNDAPVANNDSGPVVKNSGTDFGVLDNDSDADGDVLRVTAVTQPANGTTTINSDNSIRYVPRKGFKGSDTFEYVISDGNGGTARASVTVSVTKE